MADDNNAIAFRNVPADPEFGEPIEQKDQRGEKQEPGTAVASAFGHWASSE
jgi:hypothetical protein